MSYHAGQVFIVRFQTTLDIFFKELYSVPPLQVKVNHIVLKIMQCQPISTWQV